MHPRPPPASSPPRAASPLCPRRAHPARPSPERAASPAATAHVDGAAPSEAQEAWLALAGRRGPPLAAHLDARRPPRPLVENAASDAALVPALYDVERSVDALVELHHVLRGALAADGDPPARPGAADLRANWAASDDEVCDLVGAWATAGAEAAGAWEAHAPPPTDAAARALVVTVGVRLVLRLAATALEDDGGGTLPLAVRLGPAIGQFCRLARAARHDGGA